MRKFDSKKNYEEDQRASEGSEEGNGHSQDETSPGGAKFRSGSAPPAIDSSSLFLYMEDDVYTRSFSKGPCNSRAESLHNAAPSERVPVSAQASVHCKQEPEAKRFPRMLVNFR